MPRTTKKAPPKPNAIVASAARVMAGRRKNMPKGGAVAWQNEAWDMLDIVGELEFYREWISNALSRCTLKAVEDYIDDDGKPAVKDATDPVVIAAMEALFGGEAGQPEMLGTMGGHIAVPGETWLCGLLEPPTSADAPDPWRVLARDEVSEVGTKWQIDRGDGEPELYDRESVYMARIWNPHPRKWVHANSSVRAALPILRELVALSKRNAAILDSRLAGAGILCVPTEITFASPPADNAPAEEDEGEQGDPFMMALYETMMAALEDQGDASSVVPLVIKAPAEHLDKIKHLILASPLDEKAEEQRKALLARLANSLDVPAEVLTGMADVNHWTGWLLDENAIKMHVEPVLGTITRGLTTRYLWPVLQGEHQDTLPPEMRRFRIVGETDALRQRPNRSAEAQAAHANLTITDAAYAREVGFEDEDLLDPVKHKEEFRRRLLLRASGGVSTSDLVASAFVELGVPLTPVATTVNPPKEPAVTVLPEAPAPPPALETNSPPEQPTEPPPVTAAGPNENQVAACLAVSENLVLRAVERGWNRAGRRGRVRKPVPTDQLDAALSDAWTTLERNAALLGVDSFRLQNALDSYARALLASGAEHDPMVLVRLIQERVLDEESGSVSAAVVAALGHRQTDQSQQPINLTVQVAQPENHVQVHLPTGLVAAAEAPVFNVPPAQVTVNVPEQAAPEVTVNVEPTPVTVDNTVNVEPTPVTVEATVEAPQVTVESPEVNITVEPTPVEVTVEPPEPRTITRKVIRDADGNITGTEERNT